MPPGSRGMSRLIAVLDKMTVSAVCTPLMTTEALPAFPRPEPRIVARVPSLPVVGVIELKRGVKEVLYEYVQHSLDTAPLPDVTRTTPDVVANDPEVPVIHTIEVGEALITLHCLPASTTVSEEVKP